MITNTHTLPRPAKHLASRFGLPPATARLVAEHAGFPVSADATEPTSNARLRHLAEKLHALGPFPLFCFLREVEAGADLITHAERYARLPSSFVHDMGGDRFGDRMMAVAGGRP